MGELLQTAGLALVTLIVVFVPLEWALPAWRGQRRIRLGLGADLAFFAGQYLLFASVALAWLTWLSAHAAQVSTLAALQAEVLSWPLWSRVVLAIAGGDLCMYWGHRLQHHWAPLWRFHAVHHTAQRLDFLAAHREHPLDGLYTQTLMNPPAIALGLPIEHLMGLVAFRGLWAIMLHANAGLRLGLLGDLLGSTQLHH